MQLSQNVIDACEAENVNKRSRTSKNSRVRVKAFLNDSTNYVIQYFVYYLYELIRRITEKNIYYHAQSLAIIINIFKL